MIFGLRIVSFHLIYRAVQNYQSWIDQGPKWVGLIFENVYRCMLGSSGSTNKEQLLDMAFLYDQQGLMDDEGTITYSGLISPCFS